MGLEAALDVLPAGRPVSACLEPVAAWSPGEVPRLPQLLSFRKLLREQYSAETLSGPCPSAPALPDGAGAEAPSEPSSRPCEPPQAEKAGADAETAPTPKQQARGRQLKRKLGQRKDPKAQDGLSRIGRRDLLGEAIRSMENRLARQGLLAAPETILSSSIPGSKKKDSDDEFYDVNDNFIDDTELAAVNAYHTQGRDKQKAGGRREAARAELDPRPAAAAAAASQEEQAFLAGFKLTTAEVSGTSDESDWESDQHEHADVGLRCDPWRREERGWRWQLAQLQEELILVDSKPSLASPKEGETVDSQLTEEDCLSRIKALLTEFCDTADAGDHSVGRPALCEKEKLEEALANLWRRLPPLLRMPLKPEEQVKVGIVSRGFSRRFRRFKLKNLEPSLLQQRRPGGPELTAVEDQVDPFAWSAAEEFAWCCFCWRLLTSMSPGFPRARFTRQWLRAVREPQKEAGQLVQEELAARVQTAISAHEANASASKVKDMSGATWTSSALKKGVLSWPALALQTLWLRKQLWQEQRQRTRIRATFPDAYCDFSSRKLEVSKKQNKALTHFIESQFGLVNLKLDRDTVAKIMGYRAQGVPKAQGRPGKKEDAKKEDAAKSSSKKEDVTKPPRRLKTEPSHGFKVGQWVEVGKGSKRNAIIEVVKPQGEVQLRTPGGVSEACSIKKLKSAHLWKQGELVEASVEGTWCVGNILSTVPTPTEGQVSSTDPVIVCVSDENKASQKVTVSFQHVRRPEMAPANKKLVDKKVIDDKKVVDDNNVITVS